MKLCYNQHKAEVKNLCYIKNSAYSDFLELASFEKLEIIDSIFMAFCIVLMKALGSQGDFY